MTLTIKLTIGAFAALSLGMALLVLRDAQEKNEPLMEVERNRQFRRETGEFAAELHRHVGWPAPDVEFRLLSDDSPHRLSEFRGRVVLLNIWHTACGPCRKEMPALLDLQERFGRDGVAVVTLSPELQFQMAVSLSRKPLSLPPLAAYGKRFGWIPSTIFPITLFIDRSGALREFAIGGRSEQQFEAAVRRYL